MSDQTTAHISTDTALQPAILGWEMFLNDQGRSPHTVKAFLADLRLLGSFLPPDQTIGSISTTDLNNFLTWMQRDRGVPCSPKTLARRITSLKSFFRWLHEAGVLIIDPAEKVIQKSVLSPTPTVLTPEEIDQVVQVAEQYRTAENPDLRYFMLVRLLLTTGIKKSECLSISLNHLDFEAPNGPFLFIRYASPTNRYKERKIQLPEDWVAAYQEYLAAYEFTDKLFPWSPRRLEYLLEDLSNGAGLDKHLSFEMCRWTCALIDWNAGIDPNKIRQKLGISEVQWREVRMKLRRLAAKKK